MRTIKNKTDGTISINDIEQNGYFDKDNPDFHCSITKALCIENTHNMLGGLPLPVDYLAELKSFSASRDVKIHTDGARLINAAIAQG